MQVIHERCCGLDVHQKTVVACVLLTLPNEPVQKQVQTFETTTAGMLALTDWLETLKVSHVAMESTGVYWCPVFNLLEDHVEVILVNAQHMKAVPGRKTDVRDSEWLADLLRHGLLQASFIPPQPIRVLRDLVRYRKTLVYQRADEVNRLQKVLELGNIKLASVVSDIMGKSGRRMLEALVAGTSDAEALADLACGTLRRKIPQLHQALTGRVQEHHRFLLEQMLAHIAFLEETIVHLQTEIEAHLAPYHEAMELLQSIPGVQALAAAAILAEIGVDMTRFPSARHLASWAGICPGNKQSAGKRLSGQMPSGNKRLRAVLAEVVWSISHMKENYLSSQYHRLARRIGKPKAVMAVAHSILTISYVLLRDHCPYQDLGADYLETMDKERLTKRSLWQLERLGFQVQLLEKQEVPV